MPRAQTRRRKPRAWWKWAVGAALLVPAMVGSVVFLGHLARFQLQDRIQLAFVTGAGVYLVMHLLLWKPVFMHVMGHELTHAFWALLLGGRIRSLQVSQEGGQVMLSKTNFLIALAPYFFPFYTALLLPIYFIADRAFKPALAFLLGFTLAFHLALTLHSLRDRQSDIHEVGVFFSLSFVYCMNLLALVAVVWAVAPGVLTMPEFLRETWGRMLHFALWLMLGGRDAAGAGAR